MTRASAVTRLSREDARVALLAAQGFPAPDRRTLQAALESTGYVRTLGGVDVYIAVRARVPGMSRKDLDRIVDRGDAQVIPSVRGCIYLVPAKDVPFALRAADLLSRTRAERDQARAGIRPGEVHEVAKAVLAVLCSAGPLTTDGVRRALPQGALRRLGDAGKKVGVSSALPGALRLLEFDGKIERTLEGGRLDTERYLWRVPASSPFDRIEPPEHPLDLWTHLGEAFFRSAGIGTVRDFAGWAGIPQRDAKAAMERLPLTRVEVEEAPDACFMLEPLREKLLGAEGTADAVALLPFDDNLVALHGGAALLVDPQLHGMSVPSWGSAQPTSLGEAKHMSFRTIVADGKIAGFWEYDPDRREVVLGCFDTVRARTKTRLREAAADLGRFLAEDVGHGRSFSIDTDDELRKRVAQVRELARS